MSTAVTTSCTGGRRTERIVVALNVGSHREGRVGVTQTSGDYGHRNATQMHEGPARKGGVMQVSLAHTSSIKQSSPGEPHTLTVPRAAAQVSDHVAALEVVDTQRAADALPVACVPA